MITPPNKEQMLFSQMQVAEGLIHYYYENMDGTIFEGDGDLYNMAGELAVLVSRMLVEMHTQMVKSCQERKSVCY